jgi:hypothetical protein
MPMTRDSRAGLDDFFGDGGQLVDLQDAFDLAG